MLLKRQSQAGRGEADKMTEKTSGAASLADEDEPLIDRTAIIPKNSKKTRRLQKQNQQRQANQSSHISNFLEFPAEIMLNVLGYLTPSDLLRLLQVSRATRDFICQHESSIARDVVTRRYWVLSRCFPLPKPLYEVDEALQAALTNPTREKMIEVHKKPYQHIRPPNSQHLCTCTSCLLAWNNLNVVLDLGHFQKHLSHREPIPVLPRGTQPEWNVSLIARHALIVERAMTNRLTYAAILERHLNTIVETLLRQTRLPKQKPQPVHRHSKFAAPASSRPTHADTPYGFEKESDAESGDDRFLERWGKESYEFPWQRDNYYSLIAYVPNRKWNTSEQKWMYYAMDAHSRDLEWMRKWLLPTPAT